MMIQNVFTVPEDVQPFPADAVYVEEECGYQHWIWWPEGSREDTVARFEKARLEDRLYVAFRRILGGRWVRVRDGRLFPYFQDLDLSFDNDNDPDGTLEMACLEERLRRMHDPACMQPWLWVVDQEGKPTGEKYQVALNGQTHFAHVHVRQDSRLTFLNGPSCGPTGEEEELEFLRDFYGKDIYFAGFENEAD